MVGIVKKKRKKKEKDKRLSFVNVFSLPLPRSNCDTHARTKPRDSCIRCAKRVVFSFPRANRSHQWKPCGIPESMTRGHFGSRRRSLRTLALLPLPLRCRQRWKSSGNRRIRATVTIINMKKKRHGRLEIWQPSAVDVFSTREEEKSIISYFDHY